MRNASSLVVAALACSGLTAAHAYAADAPTTTTPVAPADANFKPAEKAAAPPDVRDGIKSEAQGTLGGLFAYGNTQSIAGKAGGYYQLRYNEHGFRVDVAGAVTSTGVNDDKLDHDPATFDKALGARFDTNGAIKLRYDYFLTNDDTLYGAAGVLHDSASNLLVRLRAEGGYRRFFFNTPKHSFSGEAGIVYTIDDAPFPTVTNGVSDNGDSNGDGITDLRDKTSFEATGGTLGARFMLSYTNALLDNVAFNQTLEVVPNIFPNVAAPFEQLRVDPKSNNVLGFGEATTFASSSQLNISVAANLSIALNVTFLYDNGAIARRNAYSNFDVASSISLAYKFF